jgi:hypothetical protein
MIDWPVGIAFGFYGTAMSKQKVGRYTGRGISSIPRRQREGLARSGRNTLRMPDAEFVTIKCYSRCQLQFSKNVYSIAKKKNVEIDSRCPSVKLTNF